MLFSSISPALTENGVANAQISAQLIVESADRRDTKMDGEEVQIYANDNKGWVASPINSNDRIYWQVIASQGYLPSIPLESGITLPNPVFRCPDSRLKLIARNSYGLRSNGQWTKSFLNIHAAKPIKSQTASPFSAT